VISLPAKRLLAAVLLATFIPVSTVGCFGKFALTRKVYAFNRDLSHDRWVRWFGFLIMNVVLIYAAAGAIDLVFANSIEFWGGANPFASGEGTTRYAYGPNGEVVSATVVESGTIELRILDRHGDRHAVWLVREADSVAAYGEGGSLIARIGDVSGAPAVLGPRPR
jgi:hypothetical protein